MSIKEKLQNDLKDAMRAGDDTRKSTIRLVLSAVRLVEVNQGKELDDAGVTGVLQKEVKARNEAITEAEHAKRADLVKNNQAELAILETYLPKALSSEELEQLARQAVAESGANGPAQIGQVMKILMPRLQGRASGDQANQVVRKLLA